MSSSEFHQIPILTDMSNSDLFLLQDDDDHTCRPLSFLDDCRASSSDQEDDNSDHHHDHDDHDHEVLGRRHEEDYDDDDDDHHHHHDQEIRTKLDEAKKKEEEVIVRPKMASSSLGELDSKVDSDDDGFKTPTSLDHKIPVMQQCPPAPQKPKISLKRKAAPSPSRASTTWRSLQLDFSEQIESMFPDLRCRRKIKKARRADQEAE